MDISKGTAALPKRLVKVTEVAGSTRDLARASVGSIALDSGFGGSRRPPFVGGPRVACGGSDDDEDNVAESALSLHEALESSFTPAERAVLERALHFLRAAVLSSSACVMSDLIV